MMDIPYLMMHGERTQNASIPDGFGWTADDDEMKYCLESFKPKEIDRENTFIEEPEK